MARPRYISRLLLVQGVGLWALASGPAMAEVDCDVVMSLEQVHRAHLRLIRSEAPAVDGTDMGVVVDGMVRLGRLNVTWALGDRLQAEEKAEVMRYLVKAGVLAAVGRSGSGEMMVRALADADAQALLGPVGRALERFSCASHDRKVAASMAPRLQLDANPLAAAENQIRRQRPDLRDFIVLAISGAVVTAVLWAMFIWRRLRILHRRRASARHQTNLATQVRHQGTALPGRILDISCTGAKIRQEAASGIKRKDPVSVLINHKWEPAIATWGTHEMIGVRFSTELSEDALKIILSGPVIQEKLNPIKIKTATV